tara:strand:- start:140 stop:1306 length:1167 start_codon:yes stop_codon:yes gene_type:complete
MSKRRLDALKAIYQWVIRTMMKDKTGIVQTMPNKDLVDFNVNMTIERLLRNNVDPQSLKNADQVENIINQIEAPKKVDKGITKTKTAEVFDLEGKKIDPDKGIMGGRQIDDLPPGDPDLPPPGSRGGPDDIAAPIQSEEEVLEKLSKQNKEATRNLQIKLSKDKEYQKFRGETEEEIRKRFGLDDPDKKADGGRIGFKKGMDRRTFMKVMGGLTALPILGKFFKGAKTATPAVEKAVETVTEAPSYFFDLVSKIKLFGKQRTTPSYKERVNEFTYTGKNGDQYELIEDMDSGEIMIQKDKMGVGVSGEKTFDTITDRTELRYKKPRPNEENPNPAAEYEEYKVEFDPDGTAADATEIDVLSKKDIINEVTEAPSIKKAGGGIARMLGE